MLYQRSAATPQNMKVTVPPELAGISYSKVLAVNTSG